MTNTTFEMNGTTYTANETCTHCYSWPTGLKGQRVRIKKADYEEAKTQYEMFITANDPKTTVEEFVEKFYVPGNDEPTEGVDLGINPEDIIDCHIPTGEVMDALEEAIAKVKESEDTEEIEEITKELAPKPKKTRRPKDVAFEADIDGKHITLTAKQLDFMGHLKDSCFWENGLQSAVWIDCLCDEIGGQFEGKPMTVGAMVSTLCEKGLAYRSREKVNGRMATYMGLEELGRKVAVAANLGLE